MSLTRGTVQWRSDNKAEIEKGCILKSDTIEGLCDLIMKDAVDDDFNFSLETLMASYTKYNSQCASGEEDEFGRPATHLTALDTAPYYAMRSVPASYTTSGGPVKNEKGQILNVKGEVIPRLYEAGVLGSTSNHVYSLFGQNWQEIMPLGRISDRNAAAEAISE